MRTQPVLLVVIGLLAGYVFAGQNSARAAGGGWQCYVVDRLPDTKAAMDWKGAKNATDGLNAVSPGSAAGTILTVQYPTSGSGWSGTQSDVGLICVKS
ncbi:MAG: hypothetical protein ACOZNI_05165 [Myxococcota bacterium]